MNVQNRTVFSNDNLPVLRGIDTESVDLIYLDPPFNSNRNYAAPIGSTRSRRSLQRYMDTVRCRQRMARRNSRPRTRFVSGNTRSRTHTWQRHEVLSHYDGSAVVGDEARPQKDWQHILALRPDCEPLFEGYHGQHLRKKQL